MRLCVRSLRGWPEEHESSQVFGIDNADDMFRAEGLVVDRDARMQQFDHPRTGFFNEHIRRQRKDFLPRRHDFANRDIVQFQSAMNQRLLELGEHAHAPGCGGEKLEFLGGMD